MSGKTISEKILSIKSGRDVRAGDLVICNVDYAMGTDGSAPMAIDYFEQMGGTQVFDRERIVFVLDHYSSPDHAKTVELHNRIREFARKHGIFVHEVGDGICHQLMVETGRTLPGRLIVGADSHSVMGGALNAFTTGIGSSDLAAAMICGRIWLKTPETIKVTLNGQLQPGVYPKDLALTLAGFMEADGAAYQTLEFHGEGAAAMDLEDRLVISNMSVEMGAKAGIFNADAKTFEYLSGRTAEKFEPVEADPDAVYSGEVVIDISTVEPAIAAPHSADNFYPIDAAAGTPIQMVYIGTCTGGRVRDFHQALAVLESGGPLAPGMQLVVTPASREVEATLKEDGTLAKLTAMGAVITVPGCGSCCGTAGPIPGDGVHVLSTANRNFKARMGNAQASIFLASPAACAAAAIAGKIVDPRDMGNDHEA